MIETVTTEEFERRDDLAAKAAQKYADYVHQKLLFTELSKDFLASLKMAILAESDGKMSDAECETRARSSEKWDLFRKEQEKILKEAGKAEIAYESAKRRWETCRSKLSIKKAEIERNMS